MFQRPLFLLALALAAPACAAPLTFVAPTATPSFVAGTPSHHTFRVAADTDQAPALCDASGVTQVCVDGLARAIDVALPTVLSTRLRPAAGAPDYIARFEPLRLDAHHNDYNNRVSPTLDWRFTLAIPGRATVVLLDETSGLPADGPRSVDVDELRSALRAIENAILARIGTAVDQYLASAPSAGGSTVAAATPQ